MNNIVNNICIKTTTDSTTEEKGKYESLVHSIASSKRRRLQEKAENDSLLIEFLESCKKKKQSTIDLLQAELALVDGDIEAILAKQTNNKPIYNDDGDDDMKFQCASSSATANNCNNSRVPERESHSKRYPFSIPCS